MALETIARRLLEPPIYRSGPTWANAAGWQLARVFTHHGAHALRRSPKNDELIATGERDGIVVIPNFLSDADFARLKATCNALPSLPSIRIEPNRGNTGLDFITMPLKTGASDDISFVVEKIAADQRLLDIVSALSRHKITRPPQVGYQLLKMRDGATFSPDAETILHADRHYPTIKAYYSINGSTRENGAYVWALNSHKLSRARLRYEYRDSIRFAKLRAKGVLEIPPEHIEDMGLSETPILTEPNTMVISNNFGFHRRGEFAPGAVREQLRLVFHYLEEPFYATWMWNALRSMDRRNLLPSKIKNAVRYRLT